MSSIYYGRGSAYVLFGVLLTVYFKSLASSNLSIFFPLLNIVLLLKITGPN